MCLAGAARRTEATWHLRATSTILNIRLNLNISEHARGVM
jgi:hypothetical protein